MKDQRRVVAFDVDGESVASLRQAFPEWHIETIAGASAATLRRDWNPGQAELVVIGSRANVADILGLCRELRSQAGRAHTPLLVLVAPGEEVQIRAALEAGADGCRLLPVHPKDLVRMAANLRDGNQPGRHTLGTDRAQHADAWRDEGGEG